MATQAKLNVVIVGAGGAGAQTARLLSGKLDSVKYKVIVVNPRPFYIHLVACLRMVVTDEGKLEESAVFPLDNLFVNGNGELKIGTVSSIHPASGAPGGSITLQSGESIPYRYLVLSPGSKWEGCLQFPDSREDVLSFVRSWRKKFADAQEIVLVGGGAVGIELAGELRDVYPTKKSITLIHGGKLLLNDTYPASFRSKIAHDLEKRSVSLMLDDRVDQFPDNFSGSLKTLKGKEFIADLIVPTRGGTPNTDFIRSLGDGVLTESGRVKIQPTLQLKSYSDIFAAGDILDHPEQKQVGKYGGHASTILENIVALSQGSSAAKAYKAMPEIIFVTNGKNGGWGYADVLCGMTIGNWLIKTLKSKALFVGMTRKNLGA